MVWCPFPSFSCSPCPVFSSSQSRWNQAPDRSSYHKKDEGVSAGDMRRRRSPHLSLVNSDERTKSPGKRGDTALHLAVRAGSVADVQKVFANCYDPEQVRLLVTNLNDDGETALYVSAEIGNLEVLREILKACDLEIAEWYARNHFNPFLIAAKHGHVDVLEELLQAFPALAMTTGDHFTLLHVRVTLMLLILYWKRMQELPGLQKLMERQLCIQQYGWAMWRWSVH
ncbi:unnamed protein product [Urochloa humidicola]